MYLDQYVKPFHGMGLFSYSRLVHLSLFLNLLTQDNNLFCYRSSKTQMLWVDYIHLGAARTFRESKWQSKYLPFIFALSLSVMGNRDRLWLLECSPSNCCGLWSILFHSSEIVVVVVCIPCILLLLLCISPHHLEIEFWTFASKIICTCHWGWSYLLKKKWLLQCTWT
jgi:hypothetical protein